MSSMALYNKRKELGLCVRCLSPALPNQIHCEYHRKYAQVVSNRKYSRDPEKVKARGRKSMYGITNEQYQALLLKQKGVCSICKGVNFNGRALSVDHNHKTSKIRGLLCENCNRGLGLFQDTPELLYSAILYLKGELK